MESGTRVAYADPDPPDEVVDALTDAFGAVDVLETVDDRPEACASADCVVVTDAFGDANCVDRCERIRDRHPSLPIVVFPAEGSERLAGAVVAAGADGYVPREQGVETLLARLRELCDERSGAVATDRAGPPDREGDAPAPAGTSLERRVDRLERFVEQVPFAVVEWNRSFEAIGWNAAATSLFGYAEREALGEHALDLLVPDTDRADVLEEWNRLLEGGGTTREVTRNVRADGTSVTCEWLNTPLVEDGEVVSVLSVVRDVTDDRERASALEALQETTRELMRAESVDEVAEIVVEATETVVDRLLGSVRLYEDGTLAMTEVTDRFATRRDTLPPIGPGDGILWETYERGSPTVVDDASVEMLPYDLEETLGNAIIHPLGDHGLLTVAGAEGRDLGMSDVHLVHVLATTAEAALDRAERERDLERAKAIVETVGDGVYALDEADRFVAVNDTMTELTGYDRETLLESHVSTVLTTAPLEGDEGEQPLAATDDAVATDEVVVTTASGDRLTGEVNTTPFGLEGERDGTVGIVRDVSDRKRIERELVDRKAKIEALHDVASRLDDCESREAVYELTVEAAEDVLNFDVCVVDGVRGEYLVKEALSSSLDDADYVDELHVQEGIAGRTYRTQRSYRIDDVTAEPDATSSADTYRSVLSVPVGDHGVFQAVAAERGAFDRADQELTELLLSHVTDALDRLTFQTELREERDRFAALFENVPDAVVSVRRTEDGPVVEAVNPSFERTFGYEEAELVGEPLEEFIVPADESIETRSLTDHGEPSQFLETEVRRRTANGLREFMLRVVPMGLDGDVERSFAVYTDITRQKQRQQRVEVLNRVLRHDLRNGMNLVDGSAEQLAEAVGDDHREYVETIRSEADELLALAEKTRAVERTLEPAGDAVGRVDVSRIVADAIDRLEGNYPGATVERAVPDGAVVRAADSLTDAVYQLLENAVVHSDRPSPSVTVGLAVRSGEEHCSLYVADRGPGIPEPERALLESDREITQLRHASGLGLWLVDWVATQSGGRLEFAENQPRGTVVRLRLPLLEGERPPSAAGSETAGD